MIALALLLACDAGALDKVAGDPSATEDTGAGVADTPTPTVPPAPTMPPTDTPTESGTTVVGTGETGIAPGTADTSLDPLPILPETPDVLVDCTGAADFLTIQAAIDASVSGTKIGVNPCTYFERIDFRGKSLDVYTMEGPATTILDGAGEGPIVTLTRGESDGTRLAGFTLTHGRTVDGASAVLVQYARVTLQDLVITDNYRSDWAILTLGAFVDLRDTTITANVYDTSGAAPISAETGSLLVSNTIVTCDGADQALYGHNAVIVLDSTLTCDGGYGAFIESGEIHARRSRFEGTGAAGLYASDNPDNLSERATLSNVEAVGGQQGAFLQYMNVDVQFSTFLGAAEGLELDACRETSEIQNSVFSGANCDLRGDGTPYEVEWNGFDNGAGCGILGAFSTLGDPLFVAPPADLNLQVGSPMIDAADPSYDDPDGTSADLGRWGGPEALGAP